MNSTDDDSDVVLRDVDTVTDEVLDRVVEITDGWHNDGRIDWDDVWDRLDGAELADGRTLDIPDLDSPAQAKIRRYIHKLRKQG